MQQSELGCLQEQDCLSVSIQALIHNSSGTGSSVSRFSVHGLDILTTPRGDWLQREGEPATAVLMAGSREMVGLCPISS